MITSKTGGVAYIPVAPNNAPGGSTALSLVTPEVKTRGVLDALAKAKNVERIDAGKYQVATDGRNVHVNVRMQYLGDATPAAVV